MSNIDIGLGYIEKVIERKSSIKDTNTEHTVFIFLDKEGRETTVGMFYEQDSKPDWIIQDWRKK